MIQRTSLASSIPDFDETEAQILKVVVTVQLCNALLVNSILIIGIVKHKKRCFFPYFGFTAALIILLCFATIYFLCVPKLRIYALVGLVAVGEAQFLYATVSYYKQIGECAVTVNGEVLEKN